MTNPALKAARLAFAGAVCLASSLASLGASAASDTDDARTELSASFPAPTSSASDFTDEFESLLEPVTTTSPAQSIDIPAHAVDLSTFEPPRPPVPSVVQDLGTGVASFYGRRFHGRLTANGERFDMNAMTAAHKTLPFGTLVRVTNPRNGRSVVVRINDRGPFVKGRTIDVSRAAAKELGMIARGHARVELDIIE
ncbi:septal ring lytic transglycosylase RlpA family protein [Erythrobacter sp. SCSIO 43205]|uniref:septal ring lytic transglycosylase RlpA family protein n=1 Tax=Erythrobacter sp. SCSIO 43205 TaxID=2779361 RepID=UPI002101F063|nr:septal ring lytic transglycosylase RlpA family protein [Erythrobacter sp. SCSIO 43205]